MNSYSCFSRFYDSLTFNVEYGKKADYILEILKRHNHNAGLTLDLACGTGTLTLELCKRGVDIFGADSSADMLTLAQQKASESGFSILFLRQKMQNLNLYGTIDTCICSLDSINHLPSGKDVLKSFERIATFLNPDGLFVFDANTIYKHKYVLGDNCYIYDTDDVFCAWQNTYHEEDNRVDITLDFFAPDEDGKKYNRFTEEISETAYSRNEMINMIESAGLKPEAVYDDMSFEEPKPDSQREIYVVRKE